MIEKAGIKRRRLLAAATGAASTLALGGCDKIAQNEQVKKVLARADGLSRGAQRLLAPKRDLAPEYTTADLSPAFRGNGTVDPDDEDYQDLAAHGFADWRLDVGGLVEHPARFSQADLRALPSRTQITRHDCVEGWSCIGQWKGAVLSGLLARVGLQPKARYLVFRCADPMDGDNPESKYYESIGLDDAFHPQTILAYEMNGQTLPVRHGAPLRLRVERQLGYKMAKYVMRIEAVEDFRHLRGGNGGYWEDLGYAWYAGI
ncbi:MAG: molybdopterin-binding protein [Pseudomonadota bacterium]|nr:molybdopterin-binding protein [Pseudomonadota bacterium]